MEENFNHALWMRGSDVQSSMARCADLVNGGIFSQTNASNPLFEAAATLFLIHLADLLMKANQDGKRISWDDDVEKTEKIKDVTDLIRAARNAACHVSSDQHKVEPAVKFTFTVCFGYSPRAAIINGVELGCYHANEIAIFYGTTRVYVKRQLIRCLEELNQIYPAPDHRPPEPIAQ